MPVIYQSWILRSDLQNNPEVLYLFGDNLERRGFGGQAKEMRGEPNAIGVATKVSPKRHNDAYFNDNLYTEYCEAIELDLARAFTHVKAGGVLVIPSGGLGTGLSELPLRAPNINKFLEKQLKKLARK